MAEGEVKIDPEGIDHTDYDMDFQDNLLESNRAILREQNPALAAVLDKYKDHNAE